jgi:hypothetical protein
MKEPCYMCNNAKIDEDLTDDTDFSACSIGKCDIGLRMMLCSGAKRPVRIEVEKWYETYGWGRVGIYYPNYCPNCGRKIVEN